MVPLLLAALTLEPCAIVHAHTRLPALLVRRGLPAGDVELGFITYVVPTREGALVVDPAGTTAEHAPFLLRAALPDFSRAPRVGDFLRGLPVRAMLVTHLHWDHVSGAADLPGVRLFARSEDHTAPLPATIELRLDGPPREGFPASRDVFGDGSVIALDLRGHTSGSVGYLVRGKYFFIGDAAWELGSAGKAKLALADAEPEAAALSLALIEATRRAHPEWIILPAHDLRAAAALPACSTPGASSSGDAPRTSDRDARAPPAPPPP